MSETSFCNDPDNLTATLCYVLMDLMGEVVAQTSDSASDLATKVLRRLGVTNEECLAWRDGDTKRAALNLAFRVIKDPPKTLEGLDAAAKGTWLDQLQADLMPWAEPYPEAVLTAGVDVPRDGNVTSVRGVTADKHLSDLDFFVSFAKRFGREKSTTLAPRFAKAVPPHDHAKAYDLMDRAVAVGRLEYVEKDGSPWRLNGQQYVQVVKA